MLALYILIFVIFSVIYMYLAGRASDPYGTFHISFNQVPGSPDSPRTEWLNMGFWKVQRTTCQQSSLTHGRGRCRTLQSSRKHVKVFP